MTPPRQLINQYQYHLPRAGSPHTVRAYGQDVTAFARWFEGTTGGPFDRQAVDPRNIQDYRGYLVLRRLAPGHHQPPSEGPQEPVLLGQARENGY